MVQCNGERKVGNIKVEEIEEIFWDASRMGAKQWVTKKLGGDR
jgi:hypothetical protein